ncbi:MAG: response regulator [Phycisphaerae bacterium]
MAEQVQLRKLLVLRGPTIEGQGLLDQLARDFSIEYVDSLDQALERMRNDRFVAVLAETGDFLPLERGMGMQQSSVVLDTIGDGVCIIGDGGELVWANRRLRQFPESHIESLRRVCVKVYEEFASDSQKAQTPLRAKRFSLMPEGGTYYEVICSPVLDHQGLLRQIAAVVVNATNQRRQQLKLNAIDRAGRELVRLDYDLLKNRDVRQRLAIIEERIIRCSRDVLDYEHFAVLLLNERSNRLEVVTSVGLDQSTESYELFASTQDNGICGYVASTGGSYICPDTRRDPKYLAGLTGARSSLTVPLRLHDKVIGVLNAESRQLKAFSEEDRQFAEMFANHVALALHVLNLLVYERYSTHNQLSGSICAEMAGPLNDLITAAGEIMDDYIGHDDLRKRLGVMIDTATDARQKIQALSRASETGVIDAPKAGVKQDPVLTGKKFLVVDDEELIRQTIHDVLEPYGCDVQLARNGAEAIEKLKTQRYDLVISDIKMPGATGYDVFAAAKEIDESIEVILITGFGYDPSHSIVRARKEGLAAVLMKPFKVKQLLEECRSALQRGR